MPAYLNDIHRPWCAKCGVRRATVTVMNNRNAKVGDYCRSCGSYRVRELNRAT